MILNYKISFGAVGISQNGLEKRQKEDMPTVRVCPYRNDDDGSNSAWCVQDFRKCSEERMEDCPSSKLEEVIDNA